MIDDIRQVAQAFMEKYEVANLDWVVAGGAIRDAFFGRIPKDIDIFILGLPENGEEREMLYDRFASKVDLSNCGDYLGPVITERFIPENVCLAADHLDPEEQGVKVQLMFSKHKTIDELIKSFDWSFSWCGMEKDGTIHDPCMIRNVGVAYVPLTLLNITNPFSNLRRGYRFSERYGVPIDPASMLTLVTKVKEALEKNPRNSTGNMDPIPHKAEEVF